MEGLCLCVYVCMCVCVYVRDTYIRTYEAGVSHTDAAYVHGLTGCSQGRAQPWAHHLHTYTHAVCM